MVLQSNTLMANKDDLHQPRGVQRPDMEPVVDQGEDGLRPFFMQRWL
jgi:hypothetical protein